MPTPSPRDESPIASQIAAAIELCADTLATEYPHFAERIETPWQLPGSCFDLLGRVPESADAMAALDRLDRQVKAAGIDTPFWGERFVVLQACLEALPALAALPVDDSVKAQFCTMCRHLAGKLQPHDTRLARRGDAFAELAKIVTRRRYHAGQLSFDIMDMPRAWLLKVQPTALPGLLCELWAGFGGLGPVVIPHINYWRPNPLFVTLKEQERSLRRIAKSIAADDRIKGFVSSSWVYGAAVGETTPHLAWLRDFFAVNNAYIVDAGAALDDAGFMLGSDRRRQLHAEGRFSPRETLVLWRRNDMLAWAAREGSAPTGSPAQSDATAPGRPRPRGARKFGPAALSGRYTVLDCRRLLYYKPRNFIAAVLVAPALGAAMLSGALWGFGAVMPTAACVALAMWLLQYFFLQ